MKIFFDHIAGQAQDRELIYSPATAIFDFHEYNWAIENGWQIAVGWSDGGFTWFDEQVEAGKKVWYQCRTSRINLHENVIKKNHRKQIRKCAAKLSISERPRADEYWEVYKKYISAKGYSDMYGDLNTLLSPVYGERRYIEYEVDEKLVAFSIMEFMNNSAIALQFCWDYHDPSLKLGYVNKYVQIRELKKIGCDYMYLGPSYEISSYKKSEHSGFEWWTGRKWSDNSDLYRDLLFGESNMKSMDDLFKQQIKFYSEVDN